MPQVAHSELALGVAACEAARAGSRRMTDAAMQARSVTAWLLQEREGIIFAVENRGPEVFVMQVEQGAVVHRVFVDTCTF